MAEQIDSCSKGPNPQQRVILHHHHGFGPVREVGVKEAVWITPGLLIAQNAWLASQGRPSWVLSAPPTMWLDGLDRSLTGRRILTVTAGIILTWRRLPSGLGKRPWSQLAAGRVSGLPAARRTLEDLQSDLRTAPARSLIRIQAHLPSIHEEWRVIIDRDRIAASSGYCLHEGEDSRVITTVFDGAVFDPRHQTIAEGCVPFRQPRVDLLLRSAWIWPSCAGRIGLSFWKETRSGVQPLTLMDRRAWPLS